jgi:hypothetical protein
MENKIRSPIMAVIGLLFLPFAIGYFFIAITEFISIKIFIENIVFGLFFILITLLISTQFYSFDEEKFCFHILFFKKHFPIYSFIEINYIVFGIFSITLYNEMLNVNTKGTIFVIILCTKKQCLKKIENFLEILRRKNMACIINI